MINSDCGHVESVAESGRPLLRVGDLSQSTVNLSLLRGTMQESWSEVKFKQRSRTFGICRERLSVHNEENSTPQPIDCPVRAASMSRSLGLNGRSSRRRSSRSGSGGRYIVLAALQHLLTFYFAFVFFAVVAADVEPPVILVSFIHSVVHGLP